MSMLSPNQQKTPGKVVFILEQELRGKEGATRSLELKELIANRSSELKKTLRESTNQDEFQKAEYLLHGYNALQLVIDRINR